MKGELHTRLLVAAALALTALALGLQQFQVPPEDRLAPPGLLVKVFEQVVFYHEFGPDREIEAVAKWDAETPVHLVLQGEVKPEYRRFVADYADKLSALTGLRFILADALPRDSRAAWSRIYFGPWRELPNVMPRIYDGTYYDDEFVFKNFMCMAIPQSNRSGIIRRNIIYATTDQGIRLLRDCLLEEFTQGLGLPNDMDLIRPTVFSDKSAPLELTLNDKVLVRALYDDRITPGMPKAAAMKAARAIILELTAAVRRDGPAALIHPRHRP